MVLPKPSRYGHEDLDGVGGDVCVRKERCARYGRYMSQRCWLFLAVRSLDFPDPASDPMPGLGRRAAAEPKSEGTFSHSGPWIQAVGPLAHTGRQGASVGWVRRGEELGVDPLVYSIFEISQAST